MDASTKNVTCKPLEEAQMDNVNDIVKILEDQNNNGMIIFHIQNTKDKERALRMIKAMMIVNNNDDNDFTWTWKKKYMKLGFIIMVRDDCDSDNEEEEEDEDEMCMYKGTIASRKQIKYLYRDEFALQKILDKEDKKN